MQRASFAQLECPIARALDIVGDGWTLLLLREALKGVRTFGGFEDRIGIPPTTLTRRLATMCESGLLARRRYEEHPPRDEYVLTEKGAALMPVLLALGVWGGRWESPGGAPIVPVDLTTERVLDPVFVDSRSRRPIKLGHVALAAGPGASKTLRAALRKPLPLVLPEAP
jgi:DNA-binding HxlR family transcriptional regulator